jgi:phosphatidylglycerophosphatase A
MSRLLATWFYVGLLPKMPGTYGSLAAVLCALPLLYWLTPIQLALAALAVFFVGVWVSAAYARRRGVKDPSEVVIDEVAGQWLALVPAALSAPWTLLAAFVLFRFFDILKPWPIRWLDRRLPGGWGIMADDMAAGAAAALVLIGIRYVLP